MVTVDKIKNHKQILSSFGSRGNSFVSAGNPSDVREDRVN